MLDRSQAPLIHEIADLSLPPVQRWQLDNGIPVYSINAGSQPVVRIEICFRAGRAYEQTRMAARAVTSLIREGSRNYQAQELAEHFDFYGASLAFPFSLDTSNAVLYSLHRHLEVLLPVWIEMLTEPSFPETELRAFSRRGQQLLRQDLGKVDFVAYRELTEKIFGDHHPYGYNSRQEDYPAIQRQNILSHHQRCFSPAGAALIVSGQIDKNIEQLLNKYLGQWQDKTPAPRPTFPLSDLAKPAESYQHFVRPKAVQSALYLGRRTFNRQHADFGGLYVLNNLFGGYFGSRLMENIREDKGYTYGIYSSMDTNNFDGCIHIGAEVAPENLKPTLKEIHHEMYKLCDQIIRPDELAMLRNYTLGSLMAMVDGPFNIAGVVKTIVNNDLSFDFFDQLVTTVREMDAGKLQDLAQQYLQPKDWLTVEVGP